MVTALHRTGYTPLFVLYVHEIIRRIRFYRDVVKMARSKPNYIGQTLHL
jgi:hypothetical protein